MWKIYLNIFLVVTIFLGSFVGLGAVLTKFSGTAQKPTGSTEGVSVEAGEALFWGKGKCHTCHAIDKQGSAIRCPNLGESGPTGTPIGTRAEIRAKERLKQTGEKITKADYIIESLTHPGAYVVEGFKDEMPVIWKPPIGLNPDELKAVALYLLSIGGAPLDPAEIKLPNEVIQFHAGSDKKKSEGMEELVKRYGARDRGETVFFTKAGCAACHTIHTKGGTIGPDLTGISERQPLEYIVESILEPSKVIVSGFEPITMTLKDGEQISGVKKGEDQNSITLAVGADVQTIPKDEISKTVVGKTSLMPPNYKDILVSGDFLDLIAFLWDKK